MSNSSAKRTPVSKAHAGVKVILAAVGLADWGGRKVTIVEVGPDWYHAQYIDDADRIWVVCLDDMSAGRAPAPAWNGGNPEAVTHRALEGTALVIQSRGYGVGGVEIVIPAGEDYRGAIDTQALSVLVDACLSNASVKTRRTLAELTSSHVGMRGIASALAEAQSKSLAKGEIAASYA